jgi:hypothetical protein
VVSTGFYRKSLLRQIFFKINLASSHKLLQNPFYMNLKPYEKEPHICYGLQPLRFVPQGPASLYLSCTWMVVVPLAGAGVSRRAAAWQEQSVEAGLALGVNPMAMSRLETKENTSRCPRPSLQSLAIWFAVPKVNLASCEYMTSAIIWHFR